MRNITLKLRLPGYLRQWLTHCYGNPVRFPNRSYEHLLLRRYLRKPPAGYIPKKTTPDEVAIIIPDNDLHRPEYYHHLGRDGYRLLCDGIDNLFRLSLWRECFPLLATPGQLNKGLDDWCADHGIALDYREAVRQKFYRMRRAYDDFGIFLGKKYAKSNHANGEFRTPTNKMH